MIRRYDARCSGVDLNEKRVIASAGGAPAADCAVVGLAAVRARQRRRRSPARRGVVLSASEVIYRMRAAYRRAPRRARGSRGLLPWARGRYRAHRGQERHAHLPEPRYLDRGGAQDVRSVKFDCINHVPGVPGAGSPFTLPPRDRKSLFTLRLPPRTSQRHPHPHPAPSSAPSSANVSEIMQFARLFAAVALLVAASVVAAPVCDQLRALDFFSSTSISPGPRHFGSSWLPRLQRLVEGVPST